MLLNPKGFPQPVCGGGQRQPLQTEMTLLLEAENRARSLGHPPGNLAIDLERLDDLGVVLLALMQILSEPATEVPETEAAGAAGCPGGVGPDSEGKDFVRRAGLPFRLRMISAGALLITPGPGAIVPPAGSTLSRLRPFWDPARRELRLGGSLIKKFRKRARNQEMVLASFQRQGWPDHIADPLQQGARHQDERLHDTIKNLNRNQSNRLIHFHGDGSGHGVGWSLIIFPRSSPDLPLIFPPPGVHP